MPEKPNDYGQDAYAREAVPEETQETDETHVAENKRPFMMIPFDSSELIAFIFGRAEAEEGNMPPGYCEDELIQEAIADDIFEDGRDICVERAFRFLILLRWKVTTEYAGYLAAGVRTIRFDTEKAYLHVLFSRSDLAYAIEAVNSASSYTDYYMETKGKYTIKAVGIKLKPHIEDMVIA